MWQHVLACTWNNVIQATSVRGRKPWQSRNDWKSPKAQVHTFETSYIHAFIHTCMYSYMHSFKWLNDCADQLRVQWQWPDSKSWRCCVGARRRLASSATVPCWLHIGQRRRSIAGPVSFLTLKKISKRRPCTSTCSKNSCMYWTFAYYLGYVFARL